MRAQLLMGSLGFSTNLLMVPSLLKTMMPYLLGSVTFAAPTTQSLWVSLKTSMRGLAPCFRRLSPRYMMKGSPLRWSSATITAWARPLGSDWSM